MWYCSSIKVAGAQFTPHCIKTLTPIRISFLELAAAAQSPDHNLPNFQPEAQGALHSAHSLRQRSNRCPVDHEARHRRQDRRMNESSGCAKTKLILRCSLPDLYFISTVRCAILHPTWKLSNPWRSSNPSQPLIAYGATSVLDMLLLRQELFTL